MAEPKKNKDGLIPGQLVDEKTYQRVKLEKRKQKTK